MNGFGGREHLMDVIPRMMRKQSRMAGGSTNKSKLACAVASHFPEISRLWPQMGHYAGLSGIDLARKLIAHCSS